MLFNGLELHHAHAALDTDFPTCLRLEFTHRRGARGLAEAFPDDLPLLLGVVIVRLHFLEVAFVYTELVESPTDQDFQHCLNSELLPYLRR